MGWNVSPSNTPRLEAVSARRDGEHCGVDRRLSQLRLPALVFQAGSVWREYLERDLGKLPGIRAIPADPRDALHT